MSAALLISAVLLSAVFSVAGAAKLVDLSGSRAAVRGFGASERLARPLGLGLPLGELVLAGLLLPRTTRWGAGVGALALLLAFCAAIGVAMARGKRPECHCFGQLHSGPVGWRTLARNAVIAGAATVVVISGPGASAFAWASGLDAGSWALIAVGLVTAAMLALVALTIVHALSAYGRVLVRLDRIENRLRASGIELDALEEAPQVGLAPGSAAPAFALDTLDSGRVELSALLEPKRPLLLLFTSPTCGPCSLLMPKVAEWQQEHTDELTIALLSAGDADAVRVEASAHGLVNVLLDADLAMYEAYQANGTPSAVLVSADGTIASWLAAGSDWIESLVQQTVHAPAGLPIGTELPEATLASLNGAEVALGDAVMQPTVLLFWNPSCGFCRSLHEEITAWERDRPDGAPELVVVSAGDAEDVRSERFSSQVVLDPDWSFSAGLGADGTPMAVLVDAQRRVASPVVAGGPAVLELLGANALSAV